MTRIIVLGGAGDMASRAVRELATRPEVTRLTIADADWETAAGLAAKLNKQIDASDDRRVSAVWVDANDPQSLVDAIRGHDVAASGIGPFYRYERPVAQAAIDAGVPYVSLCDDYDAVQAVLQLNDLARTAGVTVLTGLGWTPGLSNLLARKAADQLDQVEEINVAWASSASDSEGFAVILHTMHIFTGQVPSRLYGWSVDVAAGTGKEAILFPPPVGVVNCYHVGHPEPVTLPRLYSGVQTVTLKGGLSEQPLNDLAIWLARLGLTNTPAKKQALGRLIKALLPALSQLGQPPEPCSAVRVDVVGFADGKQQRISYAAAAHMTELTALPLAIGALMLARGEIDSPGVVAPEECVDPERFFAELEGLGIEIHEMSDQRPGSTELTPTPQISPTQKLLIAAGLSTLVAWVVRRWRQD
jgi:saccharopine dehydrogenase-like NADP-dependent oxidoreductase